MAHRSHELREEVKKYTDLLLELHDSTHPDAGSYSEENKLEKARVAVDVWWKLHGVLMGWAQSQILGHLVLKDLIALEGRKDWKKVVEKYKNSHDAEGIGFQYIMNFNRAKDEVIGTDSSVLEGFREGDFPQPLKVTVLRELISELISSNSSVSYFWREELNYSLQALNHGENDLFSTPIKMRKQGRPFSLRRWKFESISQVRFRMGKGIKKYVALDNIGRQIGQSSETLRSWEKQFIKSEDSAFWLNIAEICGRYEDEIETAKFDIIPKHIREKAYRGETLVDFGQLCLLHLKTRELADIEKNIQEYRRK